MNPDGDPDGVDVAVDPDDDAGRALMHFNVFLPDPDAAIVCPGPNNLILLLYLEAAVELIGLENEPRPKYRLPDLTFEDAQLYMAAAGRFAHRGYNWARCQWVRTARPRISPLARYAFTRADFRV